MGGHNSKVEDLKYDAKNWHESEKSIFYEVMKSNQGQEAHLYHFNIKDNVDVDQEINIYSKRKTSGNWVEIIGVNLTSSGFGFCGSQQNACVLTESIPYVFSTIPKLGKQQSAVALYNAIKGYRAVSEFAVPQAITDKMIGFNRSGQTKVWVNENFGMNHYNNQISKNKPSEKDILNNLINAIGQKLDLGTNLLNVVKSCGSFANALQIMKTNCGVPEFTLESNKINIEGFGKQISLFMNSNAPLLNSFEHPTYVQQPLVSQAVHPSTVLFNTPASGYSLAPNSNAYRPSSTSYLSSYQSAAYRSSYQVPQTKFSFGVK